MYADNEELDNDIAIMHKTKRSLVSDIRHKDGALCSKIDVRTDNPLGKATEVRSL